MEASAVLARDTTPEGKELVLYRRAGVYSLRLDGFELMSSRAHGSEDALARAACRGLSSMSSPRVLVGGLGFGYTLRATLEQLPRRSSVVLCEVFASLLDWNREFLGELAGRPLQDPRVEISHADVWDVLGGSKPFDAIILDVDNGPWAFTLESNQRLYAHDGLARLAGRLTDTGRLAVWSSEPAPSFERRLRGAGLAVEVQRVRARGASGPHHTVFLGVKSLAAPADRHPA